jgi:Big-like domain-containing protein
MSAVRSRVLWSGLVVAAGVFLGACGGSEPTGNNGFTATNIAIAGGNGQVGAPGQTLPTPLAVKVTNASGSPVKGSTVTFTVASGAATVSPGTATTDVNGQAQTTVTLGSTTGTVVVNATVNGTQLIATFVLTAGGTAANTACSTSSPQTFTLGQVSAGVTGTGICLSGGTAGADFALIGFYGNPDASQVQSLSVTSSGATAVATASVAPAMSTEPAAAGALKLADNPAQAAFEHALHAAERSALAPKVSGARAWFQRQTVGASANAIPSTVTVGQIITLNAQADPAHPCDAPINVAARVAAISNLAIVVADTANPLPTITDAEYASLAAMFDTLIYPVDIANFGQPTDIDHNNGKILIFFTKEVNKLTPRGSNGVIGGFFQARDLFPQTANAAFDACAGSNVGEMFYVLAPDSAGVFADPQSRADILNGTPGTLVHEFQHLINAGRRLYFIPNANFPEDVWLNEGLSHIAEELLYYHVSGLAPRQNITASVLGATQASVDAFNNYQGFNFGRYETFLSMPSRTSVYAGNDNLETRGATWNLLRYLADHHGTPESATWQSLVNTPFTGQANVANVFGPDYLTQIRDWATSVFTDDEPGVTDTKYLEPSWNMRDIFPRLVSPQGTQLGKFPLTVAPLADGSPVNSTVDAGGAIYIRFHVAPGSQASIDWSAGSLPVSPFMQFTVTRSR